MLVTLQSSLPALFFDTRFTVGHPENFPEKWRAEPKLEASSSEWPAFVALRRGSLAPAAPGAKAGSGSGSHTHLKKFMRLLSVHWSSFPR